MERVHELRIRIPARNSDASVIVFFIGTGLENETNSFSFYGQVFNQVKTKIKWFPL
jgi:hypothetical protein